MSLTEWSETLPNDNGFAGDGDDEIVAAKAGIKERLELDHQFSGELDPLEGDCDGYHKKLTMKAQSSDPTPLTGAGVLYTKLVDDVIELFFKDETTGVVNQLTEQGVLSLNTLANDINADHKAILNPKIEYVYNPIDPVTLFDKSNSSAFVCYYYTLEAKKGLFLRLYLSSSAVIGSYALIEYGRIKEGNDITRVDYNEYFQNIQISASNSTKDYFIFLPPGLYFFKLGYSEESASTQLLIQLKGVSDSEDTSDAYGFTLKGTGWADL